MPSQIPQNSQSSQVNSGPPISLFERLDINKPAEKPIVKEQPVKEKPKSSLWEEAEDLFVLGDKTKSKNIKSAMYSGEAK